MAYTKTELGRSGFNNVASAKYVGLTIHEWTYRRTQRVIEEGEISHGGLRKYYSLDQLDRIKKQLVASGKVGE